jgi:hypothetical protein
VPCLLFLIPKSTATVVSSPAFEVVNQSLPRPEERSKRLEGHYQAPCPRPSFEAALARPLRMRLEILHKLFRGDDRERLAIPQILRLSLTKSINHVRSPYKPAEIAPAQ